MIFITGRLEGGGAVREWLRIAIHGKAPAGQSPGVLVVSQKGT